MLLRYFLVCLWVWLSSTAHVAYSADVSGKYLVLNYHDIQDEVTAKDDPTTISTDTLVLHFNWLNRHGYTSIGMDDVLAAKEGRRALPAKAVMLTFDDGYASFYTRVFPLLKSFKYKAVQAIVGCWIERVKCDERVSFARGSHLHGSGELFMTWEQLREIASSGLVEFASHTYDAHHGLTANPDGDQFPAATALEFYPDQKRYETVEDYRKRLGMDLAKNNELIKKRLGVMPRIMVWPYGSHHSESLKVAQSLGMSFSMTLEDAFNRPDDQNIRRYLMLKTTQTKDFSDILSGKERPLERTVRSVHADLDYVYDVDPKQQKRNLDALIERVAKIGANTVYLQAFSDTDGDGAADSLYFPNRHLPMRADLFSHVAWRLKTRIHNLKLYAWMPVLAYHFPEKYALPLVEANPNEKKGAYHRVSPFSTKARRVVQDLYEDISRYARFDGVLFHDDATLNDYEDAGVDAQSAYQQNGIHPLIASIKADADQKKRWSTFKTDFLNQWTLELARSAAVFQENEFKTARNIYARPVWQPESEEWFAQSLASFLKTYDYTVIMAMPYMEEVPVKEHEQWLAQLVAKVAAYPKALSKTVFELQAVDWKTKKPIPDEVLARHLFVLHQNAALNLAYYPDDFPANRPSVNVLRPYFAWIQ